MGFPAPPYGAGPQIPPTTTGTSQMYPVQPWQPPYAPPMQPVDNMLTAGAGLTILGGLVIGLGWILPTDVWGYIVGFGWLMFGSGIGVALLGLGRRR